MTSKHNSAPSGANLRTVAARALAGLAIFSGAGAGLALANNSGTSEFGHTGGTPAAETAPPAPATSPAPKTKTGGTEIPQATTPNVATPADIGSNGGTSAGEAAPAVPSTDPSGDTAAPNANSFQAGGTPAP